MFLIFFVEIWTSRGVNSGIAQFHTQFIHVSRQYKKSTKRVQKRQFRKTVLKMWSQIGGKIAMLVHKVTLKKMHKSKNTLNLKT